MTEHGLLSLKCLSWAAGSVRVIRMDRTTGRRKQREENLFNTLTGLVRGTEVKKKKSWYNISQVGGGTRL